MPILKASLEVVSLGCLVTSRGEYALQIPVYDERNFFLIAKIIKFRNLIFFIGQNNFALIESIKTSFMIREAVFGHEKSSKNHRSHEYNLLFLVDICELTSLERYLIHT